MTATLAQKKTLELVQNERFKETTALVNRLEVHIGSGQKVDLVQIEYSLRKSLLEDGRRICEDLLAQIQEPSYSPKTGYRLYAQRPCQIQSLFGLLDYSRNGYHASGQDGVYPKDRLLGLIHGFTPGAARVFCREASRLPFTEACSAIEELAGLSMAPATLHRLVSEMGPEVEKQLQKASGPPLEPQATFYVSVDGTGVPVLKSELIDRQGREPGKAARTREIKLAAMFTQTELNDEGEPIRSPGSTTFQATFATSAHFGPMVREKAQQRRIYQAVRQVGLGDGAAWVWELFRIHFPGIIEILDYFHASEHATALAKLVFKDEGTAKNYATRWKALLYDSEIDQMFADVEIYVGATKSKAIETEMEYFRSNRARMDYKRFRTEGLFIGSGVVEAGCKRVIGQRLKCSGMRWKIDGATPVAALRCASISDETWEPVWNSIISELSVCG